MTRRHPQSLRDGITLIEVAIVLAIVGVVAVVLSNILVNTNRVSKHMDLNTDLITIKATAINAMDCQATIGVKNQCLPADVFQPKMANGATLFPKNSDWNVSGYCRNNRLLLKAVSAQKDPVSLKIVNVPDIFQGASALCTAFFNPGPAGDPCQAAPQLKNGVTYNRSNGPNQPCCRLVSALGTNQVAVSPTCLANLEYLRSGSGRCRIDVQPANTYCEPPNGCVFMHETWFNSGAGGGWDVDCEGTVIEDNSIADAMIVCCPFK